MTRLQTAQSIKEGKKEKTGAIALRGLSEPFACQFMSHDSPLKVWPSSETYGASSWAMHTCRLALANFNKERTEYIMQGYNSTASSDARWQYEAQGCLERWRRLKERKKD